MSDSKMGAPKLDFDWDKFDAILRFGPSQQMCADIMEVSIDTIQRRIKEKHDMAFGRYRESRMSLTKLKLQQKAITKALGGDNCMLIFCLKNRCGWKDNPDAVEEEIDEMDFD